MGAAEARSREYPVRVIYLGGLGRSGSTLLERLLGELPGVCACGEVVHLWQRGVTANERCGCGLEFSACDFWSQVGKQAFGGWDKLDIARTGHLKHAVDRIRMIPRLALRAGLTSRFRSDLAEYSQNYVRVYRAIADVSGCDAVVDSSKHASLAFCLSSCPDIDLRVIHVVRDSRAVAYSWTTKVARPEASGSGQDSQRSYMTTYSPSKAAAQWNAENGALQLLARRGTPVLRIRYADARATWVYLDPQRGAIAARLERASRWNRWLYHGFHSLDFPFLYYKRPMWDIVLIILSIGGVAISVTSALPAWRRLSRHPRRWRVQPVLSSSELSSTLQSPDPTR